MRAVGAGEEFCRPVYTNSLGASTSTACQYPTDMAEQCITRKEGQQTKVKIDQPYVVLVRNCCRKPPPLTRVKWGLRSPGFSCGERLSGWRLAARRIHGVKPPWVHGVNLQM